MARGHPHEVCVLSSSFFCDGVRCAGLTRELAELQMKRRLDASRSGVGSLSEALAIVKSLKAVLSSEAAELQADPKSLFSVLWNKIDSLALPLKVSRRGGRACFSIRVAPSEVVRRHHTHVPRVIATHFIAAINRVVVVVCPTRLTSARERRRKSTRRRRKETSCWRERQKQQRRSSWMSCTDLSSASSCRLWLTVASHQCSKVERRSATR